MIIRVNDEESLIDVGRKLGKYLFPDAIITLRGDLGAGKTTLTKGIGQSLGIKKIINSPTFTILKIYQGTYTLYHFDAYRLEDSDEELGFEELFDAGGICVIEWPDYINEIIPKERLEITITINNDATRSLNLKPVGKEYEDLVGRLMND